MRKIVLDCGWGCQYVFDNEADALLVISKLAQTIQLNKEPRNGDEDLEVFLNTTIKTYTLDEQVVQDALNFKLLEGK